MVLLSIDPGSEKSAALVWNGEFIEQAAILPNIELIKMRCGFYEVKTLVIESIQSYGMPVGREIFDTVFWSGRFAQAFGGGFFMMPRREVKLHICGDSRAKDGNIRQAMIDRFGPVPTKKLSTPAYGGFKISKDLWAAWALAVTFFDQNFPD